MKSFGELQRKLGQVLALNSADSTQPHVLVALPSYSVGETLLAHYAPRLPALEHRFLVAMTLLGRIRTAEMIYVATQHPGTEVVEHYVSLARPADRASIRARLCCVVVPDSSPRSVAAKLLDDPTARAQITARIGDRPAFIEPWNVTETEVDVAESLQLPLHGTSPDLRHVAFKSQGRRILRQAGVPVPFGSEDVRTVEDVVTAAARIRDRRPACRAVVVKHDDSGAGDGNAVLQLDGDLDASARTLPDWYRADLRAGGVVEELVAGLDFRSPSAQVDVGPDGTVVLLATHEQQLGGPDGQVYLGCRFPASKDYAAEIGRHAIAVGARLAREGVIGRLSVDFAAALRANGRWDVYALEINLRKGGTTHPYTALRNLVPGRYDAADCCWYSHRDGTVRAYHATDNLVDSSWLGVRPVDVIDALVARRLAFDRRTGVGVVPHMLSCLAVDGRFGLTAIGADPHHASQLVEATREAVDSLG